MSHFTNFQFQYTSRSLIIQTMKDLDFSYFDGEVSTYATDTDKAKGKPSIVRPGIIAKNDGFNYYMEKMGDYYELSIEKSQMTESDLETAKLLGSVFQKKYVKNAVLKVLNEMEKQGHNCVLDETEDGYEIKFGNLYEKSIFVKLNNGRVEESVSGVKGEACQSITETLENLLSSPTVELNTEWTPEYYETDDNLLSVYDLNTK